jgi:hypothetical protein
MASVHKDPAVLVPTDVAARRAMLVQFGVKMPGTTIDPGAVEGVDYLQAYRGADEETLATLQLHELGKLVCLIWAGRNTIEPDEEAELDRVGKTILINVLTQQERQKALAILFEYAAAGISVPGFQVRFGQTHQEQAAPQKTFQEMSFDELCTAGATIYEKIAEVRRMGDDQTTSAMSARLGELKSAVLDRFQNLDDLTLDQLVKMNRIVCIGESYGHYSGVTLERLDAVAAAALRRIKSDNLLETPRPDVTDAASIQESADAFYLQPITERPKHGLEWNYLSDYLIVLFLHRSRPRDHQAETAIVRSEPAPPPVLYEPYLVGTIQDFFADRWAKFRAWITRGNTHE